VFHRGLQLDWDDMWGFVVRRTLVMFPVILFVGIISFLMIRLVPGNPAEVMLGPRATQAAIEALTKKMGYDRPLYVQFFKWLSQVVRGDFGTSVYSGKPVLRVILSHAEPSVLLSSISLVVYGLVGVCIGILSAVKQNSWFDQLSMVIALVFASIPWFWFCLCLMLVFSSILHWLPSSGYPGILATGDLSNFRYLVLPCLAIAIPTAGLIARITRSYVLDIMRMEYIVVARSKGLRESLVIMKHVLRNALNPILTILAMTFADLIVYASVTETVFNIPGIGRLVVYSILQRDYPVLQGVLMLAAALYLAINFLCDIAYAIIDPRIEYR